MKRKLSLFSIMLIMLFSCCLFSACGSNITLTINFDSNGGSECKTIVYEVGRSFNMPDDPTKENFIFDGWYSDNGEWQEEFTINTILNYPLSKSTEITLYAKWIEKLKLVFDSNCGSECESIYVESSNTTLPTPTLDGYLFKGWYLDNTTFQNQYEIGNQVESDNNEIILYAKWEKIIKKTIYYQSDEFTLEKEYDIISNYEEIDLYRPIIFGYTFAGWFYDEDFEQQAPNKMSHSMIDTYNNAITLYAKFTEKEINKISLVGELKTTYEYGEEFDSNGAKIKIEYVDKNFDDELIDITKDMVSSFFTVDNKGHMFQLTENGIKDEANINFRGQSLTFEYFVNSDIKSFSVIDTSELVFTHGGNRDFRNKNINISWTDKNNNSGETQLTEFSDYTMNYYIEKKRDNTSNIIYYNQFEILPMPGQIRYLSNRLSITNYGTFTAVLRYHFKTIEVQYQVLPNDNIVNGGYYENVFKNQYDSLQLKSTSLWLYDSETCEYIEWSGYDNNVIVKDIDTSLVGNQKAIMSYNGKEIEIDYYVIDTNEIVSAEIKSVVRVKGYQSNSGIEYIEQTAYSVSFTLSDGHIFETYIQVEDMIGFDNSEVGSFSCKYIYGTKEITINYAVVGK